MKERNLIIILGIAVVILSGAAIYFVTGNKAKQSLVPIVNVASKQNNVNAPAVETTNKNSGWKNFSWNGRTLSFKYPADSSVIKVDDIFSIDQYFDIAYFDRFGGKLDQAAAEKYLKTIYKYDSINAPPIPQVPDTITWTADKTNPQVKVANLWPYRIFAAYSQELGEFVAFRTFNACIFDCQQDQEFLESIKLEGVSVYKRPE